MNKLISFVVITLLLSAGGVAQAVPMYYTFEGTITVMSDDAGIIADSGFELGSQVSYTFLIDFDIEGSYTLNSGEIIDVGDRINRDTFYGDYIEGSMLNEKDGGFYNAPTDNAESNYGIYNWLSLYTGSRNSNVFLAIYNSNSLELGTTGRVSNTVYDSYGVYSQLDAQDLVLTSITSVPTPVPEPSTIILLGTGIVGMIATRKKQLMPKVS